MHRTLHILLSAIVLLICGCQNQLKISEKAKENEGTLRLKVAVPQPKYSPSVSPASRAKAELEMPSAADFRVEIFRTEADKEDEKVFSELFGNLPYAINLLEGNYSIVAENGVNELFVLENPLYRAVKDEFISRGFTSDVTLTATIVPFAVQINCNKEHFAANFATYRIRAEIDDVLDDAYVFGEDGQSPRAFFMPSRVRLILEGTTKQGKPHRQVISEIESEGRELYTLNLNIDPKGHIFEILVDTERQTINSEAEIGSGLYPDMPAVPASTIAFHETADAPISGSGSSIELRGIVGLKNIEFTVSDDTFAPYGLAAGTYSVTNAEQMAALQAAGVLFESGLADKIASADPLALPLSTTVDFAPLACKMLTQGGVTTSYVINCKTTDALGSVSSNDQTIAIEPPLFSMPEVLPGDVWTRTASFSPLEVTGGNLDKIIASGAFKYQISSDGSTWNDVVANGTDIEGLACGTAFYLRAQYRDYTSNTVNFTTETPMQIPGSDLNNWSAYGVEKDHHTYSVNGGWWATRNSLTNQGSSSYLYVRMSGTKPKDADNGKCAELTTIGWGSGNTCVGSTPSGAVVKNITAAMLFVGEYDGGEKYGKPFNAKPTALSFHYKAYPVGGDNCSAIIQIKSGDNIIGQATFKVNQDVGSYTQQVLPVAYDPQYKNLAPTTISIVFKSGDNEGDKKYLNKWVKYFGTDLWDQYAGWASEGSKFYVDEISLIFDK